MKKLYTLLFALIFSFGASFVSVSIAEGDYPDDACVEGCAAELKACIIASRENQESPKQCYTDFHACLGNCW